TNKYIFTLQDLSETASFYATAEDYWTVSRQVVLVPPPAATLTADIEEPAYLHYRYSWEPGNPIEQVPQQVRWDEFQKNALLLKGKRQRLRNQAIETTGPRSVRQVPLGSNVTLVVRLEPGRTLQKNTAQVVAPVKPSEAGSVAPVVTPQ